MANKIEMMYRLIITVILSMVLSHGGWSQAKTKSEKHVIVYLKDGSAISGNLMAWTYGQEVIIDANGITMKFPDAEIKKVVEQSESINIKAPVTHRNNGIYYTGKATLMAGNDGPRANDKIGYGITASVGYQWNKNIGAGIGIGYREFVAEASEEMYPIFAEFRGFINDNAVRPFYNVELGYAFAFKDEEIGLVEAKGGLFVYPSIGISLGRKTYRTTIDVGYNFQQAEFTYGSNFDDRVRSFQEITFRRLSLRLGVHF